MKNGKSVTTAQTNNLGSFYLESDKKRARIGLLLLIIPIIIFSINDFLFFGVGSQTFYGLATVRAGLLVYTIGLLIYMHRIKHYSAYVGLMTIWTIIAASVVVAINLTRPSSFIPFQLVTTILFILIAFAVIPNRLRYQITSASIIIFGEIGILLFYSTVITRNALITGLGSIVLAFIIGLVSSWQLIVYRKENFEAHEKLRQRIDFTETKFADLVEKLPEMFFELDSKGKVSFANQRARELTGYTKDEFENNFDANRLVAPEDVERSKVNMIAMLAGEMRHSNEYIWIRKDGTRFPVLLNSIAVKDTDGKIIGARGVVTDMTERKEMEKQLQSNERLAAIGQTAGMVGHDIRNPLQAIVGELHITRSVIEEAPNRPDREEALESVNFIQAQVDYINKIVSDLQDYARPIAPEYSIADLSDVFVHVFETIKVPKSINLSINVKDAEKIKLDPSLLQRVVTNLVNNAIQAMPEGGKLEVCGEGMDSKIVITVSDTGIGIPDEVKPKLFTPMMTTKSKGQGFGLAVSKRIIETMKGKISFESEKGKGTKFIIELPINQ